MKDTTKQDLNFITNVIRKANLIGLNVCLLLVLPNYLNECGFENPYTNLASLGSYLFVFFSSWILILFIILEIWYLLKNKISFFKHFFC